MGRSKKDVISVLGITLILVICSIFISGVVVRGDVREAGFVGEPYANLIEGKNNVTFNVTAFARDVVIMNPEIESISYYDPLSDKTTGYVNVFGGIGKNFLIVPGTTVEISVRNTSVLRL